jgi:hypothetical protein
MRKGLFIGAPCMVAAEKIKVRLQNHASFQRLSRLFSNSSAGSLFEEGYFATETGAFEAM